MITEDKKYYISFGKDLYKKIILELIKADMIQDK
jgi:hypothetical protein